MEVMEQIPFSLATEFHMPWIDSFDGIIHDLSSEYESVAAVTNTTTQQQPPPSPSQSSYVDPRLGHGHSPTHSSYFDVSTPPVSSGQSPTDSAYVDTLDSGSPIPCKSLFSGLFDQDCAPFPTSFESPGIVRIETNDTSFYPTVSYSDRKSGYNSMEASSGLTREGSLDSYPNSSTTFSRDGSMGGYAREASIGSFSVDGSIGSIVRDGSFATNTSIPATSPIHKDSKQLGEKYFQFGQQQDQEQSTHVRGNCWNAPPPLQFPLEPRPKESDPAIEESGVRLVHLMLACAEAIQRGDLVSAESTVRKINHALDTAPPQTGAMGRVAAHFAVALTRRIYAIPSDSQESMIVGIKPEALSELLHFHFYEMCPYLKFAHFTANQAILEAFKGEKYVHVIDFNLNHGLQWPALIQALALRQGGPPFLRLTGIGPPETGGPGEDSLKEIGMSLAQLAESVNVQFEFRGVRATKLDDIQPWMLQIRPGEAIAVNSMMQLHKLLFSDLSTPAGIDEVLRSVRSLNPKIVTMSEQEANHNNPNFLDRFMEALHFYSSMFDSLEACRLTPGSSEQMLAEMYLGREICNVVATEGAERTERHETLEQWRMRMHNARFQQVHMGPNAFKQASMLLTLFSGEGYRVEDDNGCLTLGWHSRPLIAASAWQCC